MWLQSYSQKLDYSTTVSDFLQGNTTNTSDQITFGQLTSTYRNIFLFVKLPWSISIDKIMSRPVFSTRLQLLKD